MKDLIETATDIYSESSIEGYNKFIALNKGNEGGTLISITGNKIKDATYIGDGYFVIRGDAPNTIEISRANPRGDDIKFSIPTKILKQLKKSL